MGEGGGNGAGETGGVEEPRVEEVGGYALGFELEAAELEDVAGDGGLKEVLLELGESGCHGGRELNLMLE